MYIVLLSDNTRHSAWNTKEEALKQCEVLEAYGYKDLGIDNDDTTQTENGHYYV